MPRPALRLAAGALLGALVGIPGPADAPVRVVDSTGPMLGIERVVGEAGADRDIGVASVEERPDLLRLVGNRDEAVDPAVVLAVAGDPEPAPTSAGIFPVGDSTFVAVAAHLGHGSAYPGSGFALAPLVDDRVNPLTLPPADFDGVVVIGVSIWDAPAADLGAYAAAVERYRTAGHPVVIVEVPERFGPGAEVVTTPAEIAELAALNHGVAQAVGCAPAPWSIRDVETPGDIGPSNDHIHPTEAGVEQLLRRLSEATLPVCVP